MILLVDKIEKSFGARTLFTGATLQLNAGERYALVGPNGANTQRKEKLENKATKLGLTFQPFPDDEVILLPNVI